MDTRDLIKLRIGNIEASNYYQDNTTGEIYNKRETISINQWFPNKYFGNEDKYDKVSATTYKVKNTNNSFIDKSCFKWKETCCTIAYIKKDDDDDYCLETVGNRPFNIDKLDYDNYCKLIKLIFNTLKND